MLSFLAKMRLSTRVLAIAVPVLLLAGYGIVAIGSTPAPKPARVATPTLAAGYDGQLVDPAYVFPTADAFFLWVKAILAAKNYGPEARWSLEDSAKIYFQ